VVGDVLLDRDVFGHTERISPDAPVPVVDVDEVRESPGGAGLTALLCAGAGVPVTLVAPIAADDAGAALRARLCRDVELIELAHEGASRVKTRVRSAGQSLLRLDDGGPGTPTGRLSDAVRAALCGADVVLVSDYGAGTTHHPLLRGLLADVARTGVLVWDPHPRGAQPVPGAALATPNLAEANGAAARLRLLASAAPDVLADSLRHAWDVRAVCVTAGSQGAYLSAADGEAMFVPAPVVSGGDPCGAGDRFSASAAVALARGAVLSEAVEVAVADASAWVGAGGAEGFRTRPVDTGAVVEAAPGGPRPDVAASETAELAEVVARVRAGGGTLVATGGCFDILHAGHVASLDAARRLGDALVVLVNSDESVRRLKGPGRPVVHAQDRVRVLQALSSVDAVALFTEDDPRAALDRLRPDVWVKGGDYDTALMPEADLVRSWGGRVVLLPYVDGRSTTSILRRSSRSEQEAL
jgi:rfaE bifunctional protein nucleotidyltransferase chain/domain/rfaE bifunctional protein kinase chain/domain